MSTTTNLTTLKINYLTQAQYDTALANNQINEDEIYLTPDNNPVFHTFKGTLTYGGTNLTYCVEVDGVNDTDGVTINSIHYSWSELATATFVTFVNNTWRPGKISYMYMGPTSSTPIYFYYMITFDVTTTAGNDAWVTTPFNRQGTWGGGM